MTAECLGICVQTRMYFSVLMSLLLANYCMICDDVSVVFPRRHRHHPTLFLFIRNGSKQVTVTLK